MESLPPNATTAGTTTVLIAASVARLRAGDESARDQLLTHARRRMALVASAVLRRFPLVHRFHETDDVVQIASMKLNRALESVVPTDARHFFRLASKKIREVVLDLKEQLGRPIPLGGGHATAPPPIAGSRDPVARVDQQADAGADDIDSWLARTSLLEALDRLEDDLRETVDLYIIQGLPREDVAQLLGVSERTVTRSWTKAKMKLAEFLAE